MDVRGGLACVDRRLCGRQRRSGLCGQEAVWTSEDVWPVWTGGCVDVRGCLASVDRRLCGRQRRSGLCGQELCGRLIKHCHYDWEVGWASEQDGCS